MRKWLLRLSVPLVILLLAVWFAGPRQEAPKAGIPTQLHLDLVPSGPPAPGHNQGGLLVGGIPANCATWHELYPAFCVDHHQDGYTDNDGDGDISVCDHINLGGNPFHITWVGPTYYVTCSTSPGGPPIREAVFEPVDPNPTGNPICEVWHEVWPNYCNEIHIDSWLDNGNGRLDECDFVDTQNDPSVPPGTVVYYHIDRIGCDIIVEPGPTPIEESTWSKIKNLFLPGN